MRTRSRLLNCRYGLRSFSIQTCPLSNTINSVPLTCVRTKTTFAQFGSSTTSTLLNNLSKLNRLFRSTLVSPDSDVSTIGPAPSSGTEAGTSDILIDAVDFAVDIVVDDSVASLAGAGTLAVDMVADDSFDSLAGAGSLVVGIVVGDSFDSLAGAGTLVVDIVVDDSIDSLAGAGTLLAERAVVIIR